MGAFQGGCFPYSVWSGAAASVGYYYSYDLSGGRLFEYNGPAGHTQVFSLSVRWLVSFRFWFPECVWCSSNVALYYRSRVPRCL